MSGHGLSLRERKLKMFSQKPTCCYCGKNVKLKGQPRADRATLDHMKPRSKGGTNGWHNLALACAQCNYCKDARTPQQWAADILAPVTGGLWWKRWFLSVLLKLV